MNIVKGMARVICETKNVDGFKCTCPQKYEPEGNNWCNHNRAVHQARAALLWLADNVTEKMARSAYVHTRETDYLNNMHECIEAAIRAAAGEEGK